MGRDTACLAEPSATPAALRATAGLFATGITVVTAMGDGLARGITANSFTSVSLDPPLVLVCLNRTSVMRGIIDELGQFAISLLAAEQHDVARHFADPLRPPGPAQFEAVRWRAAPATGAPLLDGALAWIECTVHDLLDGGDHVIVLGRVLDLHRSPGREPLVYFDGAYRQILPQR